jgi:hypothetical protein
MLSTALSEPARRQQAITEFQPVIWNSTDLPESSVEILRDLAYDLDYYEPDAEARAEDGFLYGDDRSRARNPRSFAQIERLASGEATGSQMKNFCENAQARLRWNIISFETYGRFLFDQCGRSFDIDRIHPTFLSVFDSID